VETILRIRETHRETCSRKGSIVIHPYWLKEGSHLVGIKTHKDDTICDNVKQRDWYAGRSSGSWREAY
jgi:hypothetical protein